MNETTLRQEVFHLLRTQYRYWPITQTDAAKCPKCFTLVTPASGRPDIFVLNTLGRTLVIEMKAISKTSKSFAFSKIEPQQRQWLSNWMNDGGLAFLGIGELKRGRKLWIIPWHRWLKAEEQISKFQSSIPVIAGKGMNRQLQSRKLDMVTLFAEYELKRKKGLWVLPTSHMIEKVNNDSRNGTNFTRPVWGNAVDKTDTN